MNEFIGNGSRPYEQIRKIVVPVAGEPNSSLAVYTAVSLARNLPEPADVVMVHVNVNGLAQADVDARAHNTFRRASTGVAYDQLTQQIVKADTAVEGILQAGGDADMIVIGATRETLFRNLLLGNVSQQVAEQAHCPVMLVKRRSTILESVLRETVLPPIHHSNKIKE